MITTTIQAIVNQAAEAAGRTRDKVPPSELLMLLGWVAADLPVIWQGAVWPELLEVAPAAVAVTNHAFSKQEGTAAAMGDVLGYYEREPNTREEEPWFDFNEGDNEVHIESHHSSVWPVYQLPCPDLNALEQAQALAYEAPRRFRNYLAYRAAANLLEADQTGGGTVCRALANEHFQYELTRAWDALPGWLKRIRLPRSHRQRIRCTGGDERRGSGDVTLSGSGGAVAAG